MALPVQKNWLSNIYLTIVVVVISFHAILAYEPIKIEIPQNGETLRIFSDDDISQYDGSNPDQPIYMAVKGVVFDVSSGRDFYGKGASYNALAGKDCTRAVAKMSLDPVDFTSDISDLSDNFLKALDDVYKGTYLKKYPIVGYMDYLLDENERRLFGDEL